MPKEKPLKSIFSALSTLDKDLVKLKIAKALDISHASFYRKIESEEDLSPVELQTFAEELYGAATNCISNLQLAVTECEKSLSIPFTRKTKKS